METTYLVFAVFSAALATYLTRILPFLIFKNKKIKKDSWLHFFQQNMPLAILTALLIYSLKDAPWTTNFAYKELLSIVFVMASFLKYKNALLSIFLGVALYMFLLRI